jgi:hypothetical protein
MEEGWLAPWLTYLVRGRLIEQRMERGGGVSRTLADLPSEG